MNTATDEPETLELVEHKPKTAHAIAVQQPQSPMAMMVQAQQMGVSLDTLERMWALQVKFEEREAMKAYVDAMAEFKKNPPKILKDKHVHYVGAKGDVDYDHATHYGVTSAILAGLAAVGITHKWTPDQSGKTIGITCTLTHTKGHSESVRLEAMHDETGGKNSIQAMASAKSYLERHTLTAVSGISTADMHHADDDGRGAGGAVDAKADADAASFALRDDWIARLNAAINEPVLQRTWKMALDEIHPLNRMDVYGALRDTMQAKLNALRGVKS
jgi:hypothetical protein